MKLAELFPEGGRGVIGTADAKGVVNQAVFAPPLILDDETLVWGFSDGRSYQNLQVNPHASFLYLAPNRGCNGWRVTLVLKEFTEGELLEKIRHAAELASVPSVATEIKHAGVFKVDEVRSLT